MDDPEREPEQLLKESGARLRLALDSVGDGAWDWNVRSGEVFYSDRWIGWLGFARRDVRPHVGFWEDLVHPEDAGWVNYQLTRHLSGESPAYHCEYRIRTASGDYRYTLGRGRVVERGEDGSPVRMLGTNCDVHEQRQGERALQQAGALNRSILDTAGSAVVCLDLEQRILEFNPAAEALYGVTRGEVLGRNYVDCFLPEALRARVASDIEQVLAGSEARSYEDLIQTRGGGERWVSWNVTRLLDPAGRPRGIVAVGQDRTEIREAEQRREEALSQRELALAQVRILSGLLPICAGCKRVRSDAGYWSEIEEYLEDHAEVQVSHGICPACRDLIYRPGVRSGPTRAWPPPRRVGWDHLLSGPPPGRVLLAETVFRTMERIRADAEVADRVQRAATAEEFWRLFLAVYDQLADR